MSLSAAGADVDSWARNLEVRWAQQKDFLEIKASPVMALDHFPDRIYAALDSVSQHYGYVEDLEVVCT